MCEEQYILILGVGGEGFWLGGVNGSLGIVCLLFIETENYKSMTYTRIKLYIILSLPFFPRINNTKVMKEGAPIKFF